MKKHPVLLQLLFMGLVLSLLITSISPVSGQNGTKLYISELDCSTFPTVTLNLRGLDENNNIISADLLANTYAIYENDILVADSDIQPMGSQYGPKYVVFSFELGKSSNMDLFGSNIKSALQSYASDYFTDGSDTVQIVVHTKDGTQEVKDILAPTKSLSVFEGAVDGLKFTPSGKDLEGYLGLEKLYASLSKLNPGRYSMAIIYFNRLVTGFTTPDEALKKAQSLGKQFGSHNIRIYILNTYLPGWAIASPSLNDLASLSGGDIFQFSDSSIRPDRLTQIFNSIKNNSQVYSLKLRAHQYKDVKYSVVPKGGSLAAATDSLSCPNAPALSLPVVQITQPKGENPVLYLKQGEKTVTITADLVDWPKDGSRRVSLVELYNGEEKIASKTIPADSTNTSFNLDLDVSNLVYTATYHLHIKVIDEFGLSGDSPESVVSVNPYKSPAETAVPTSGPQPTATLSACSSGVWNAPCITSTLKEYLVWIILFVFLVVIIVLFITVRRLSNLAKPAREAISKGFDQVRKTLLGGGTASRQEVIAYLNVLMARPDRTGGKIEIYNNRTSIGRDPKVTDVQLYDKDEASSISSLHCTIFYDQGKFYITDDNSTNGTFVNGKRLDANEPYDLANGDEIILGDVFRQGAKLRFEIASAVAVEPSAPVEEESDFHVDMPVDGTPPKPAVDDFRKTVPGYREDVGTGNETQPFHEPPSPPSSPAAPQPAPVKKPAPPKSGKKGWMDEL